MKVNGAELRRVALPLRSPFRASHGVEAEKQALLVRLITPEGDGWGECGALSAPTYSPEWVDGAIAVTRTFLLPALLAAGDIEPERVQARLAAVRGHHMAKAALEMAVLDASLRSDGRSLASFFGVSRDKVPAGVAVGLDPDAGRLVETVAGYVEQGYRCIKLKIAPGHDLVPVAAVRAHVGTDVALLVDANGSYGESEAEHLAGLDDFDLLAVEQPLEEDDLLGHARLARRLRTPICLDESVVSAGSLNSALGLDACSAVNLKAGRVGGYLAARRIHDRCQGAAIDLRCGGMLETGLGRAANLALAALSGFTMPGDLSASDRYFAVDLTEPFVLDDGMLAVPDRPGLGVAPEPDVLERVTVWREWIAADD